ncbi:hypothetical protein EXIGLDRAFT_742325, partial [Exidia glandulosa HHB12029]
PRLYVDGRVIVLCCCLRLPRGTPAHPCQRTACRRVSAIHSRQLKKYKVTALPHRCGRYTRCCGDRRRSCGSVIFKRKCSRVCADVQVPFAGRPGPKLLAYGRVRQRSTRADPRQHWSDNPRS